MPEEPEAHVHESFLASLDSPDLRDLITESADITLDAITDSELLKTIPVFGAVVKLYGGIRTIRDRFFLKKMFHFFGSFGEIPQEDRDRFQERMKDDPKEAQEVTEAFLIWLDRLDVLDKAELLAKIFELFIRGTIDYERASRFASVVDKGHIPYLLMLRDGRMTDTVKSHFVSLGLIDLRTNWSDVKRQFDRDVPIERVKLLRLDLNEDGQIFKNYVIEDVPVRLRITNRTDTPLKPRRGSA